MNSNNYRIRLYGQSSKDPWKFCNNLASILGVEKEAARGLLAQAPVVIMENLKRDKGEALLETIRYIGGLCLLEPMSGPVKGEEVFAAFNQEMLVNGSQRKTVGWDSQVLSLGRITAAAVILIMVFVVGGLLAPSNNNVEMGGLRALASPVESYDTNAVKSKYMVLDELWSRYESLEAHTDSLRFEYKRTKKALEELNSRYPYPSQDELRVTKQDAMIAKDKLDYNLRRLKRLARKIRSLEYMEELSLERKVGVAATAWNN